MRIHGGTLCAFIAAFALVPINSAALAQEEVEAEVSAQTFSPEDDLNCVLFVGEVIANIEASDPQAQEDIAGIVGGMMYFLGRWERAIGGDLTEALTSQYLQYRSQNPQELGEQCSERMIQVGGELQVAGAALVELEQEIAAAEQEAQ
ncbi:MAG: hypothetical protein ABJP48_01005 [Erythrobacter sp.]